MSLNHPVANRPSDRYFGVYRSQFRLHAHQLIAWGHSDARYKIQSNDEDEPSITGYITEAIRSRLRTNSPPWCVYYCVREDTPIETNRRSGRNRLRPDIIIETILGSRPEYTFEAKRLRKKGYGADKYINSKGVGRFVSGQYALRYDEAAMLGYVQSDSLVNWQEIIKNMIAQNAKQLCLKSSQKDDKVIDDLPLEWVSQHERPRVGRPICIYHILLDCVA